jgi:hypothetical protein
MCTYACVVCVIKMIFYEKYIGESPDEVRQKRELN